MNNDTPPETEDIALIIDPMLDYSTTEAANLLNVTRDAVNKAAFAGRLEGRKLSSGWIFTGSALLKWNEKRRRGRPVGAKDIAPRTNTRWANREK